MSWLPTVVWKGSAWRLPLSLRSADLLAALFMDRAAGEGPMADPEWASVEVAQGMAVDPSLMFFAAIERVRADPSLAAASLGLVSLAEWFTSAAPGIWQLPPHDSQGTARGSGEALGSREGFFEQPPDASAEHDTDSYAALYRATLAVPLRERLRWLPRWLERTGPGVPEEWQRQWPTLVDDLDACSVIETDSDDDAVEQGRAAEEGASAQGDSASDPGYGDARVDLWRLARLVRNERALSERFASRLHLEKMASLRQLAYGLSHEINNPLANIRTRAEHLLAGERDAERRTRLERIVDQAMRAHEMIADLMYFARPPAPAPRTVDAVALTRQIVGEMAPAAAAQGTGLTMIVQGVEAGSQAEQGRGVRIRVEADPAQVGDALRALVRNSLQAIGERGAIEIRVGRRGKRCLWIVADSGPGLSPEARRHAFDPYYSGREAGRGLGLGLSRAYRVARAHGGGVTMEGSSVGCRVRFWVRAG